MISGLTNSKAKNEKTETIKGYFGWSQISTLVNSKQNRERDPKK